MKVQLNFLVLPHLIYEADGRKAVEDLSCRYVVILVLASLGCHLNILLFINIINESQFRKKKDHELKKKLEPLKYKI